MQPRLFPGAGLVVLAALTTTDAFAGRQPAVARRLPAAVAATYDAYCNDGSLPSYSVSFSTSADPVERQSWVVFLKGGGSCNSEESCVARWSDVPNPTTGGNDGIEDGEIGNHWVMTSTDFMGNANASRNFDGGGILDFDGMGQPALQEPEQTNPFDGFNRLYVHYCSSDAWRGRGGEQNLHLTPGQLLHNALNGPFDPDFVEPPQLPGRSGNILFAGANIAEAVFSLLVGSGRAEGGEIVLAGSSGGAAGVISNLDLFADILRDAGSTATLFGVIDSATGVVSPTASRPFDDAASQFWSGDPGLVFAQSSTEWDLGSDQDCRDNAAANPTDPRFVDNPFYCEPTANLVLTELETPFLVAVNSYDIVIHDGLRPYALVQLARESTAGACDPTLDLLIDMYEAGTLTDADAVDGLGTAGIGGLPGCGFTLMEVFAMQDEAIPWIRNAITDNISAIGEGTREGGIPTNPKRFGYYVPNYIGLHQLLAEGTGQRMFYSDATAATTGLLDPQLGVHDFVVAANGDGGTTDRHTLAETLGHFRDMVNGAAPLVPDQDAAPYRPANDYWSNVVP